MESPSVFKDEKRISSGKSFSQKDIRKRAEKLAKKRGIKLATATKIVRRNIARLKVVLLGVPIGGWRGGVLVVKDYEVKIKRIPVKFGKWKLWKWRGDKCSCPASWKDRRCWHLDFADYLMDGCSVEPKKYGPFHLRALKRLREIERQGGR
tara:strand:+ start:461 stop:913 length:453 start_codon:yes stop_codon:yes gene_type:complete